MPNTTRPGAWALRLLILGVLCAASALGALPESALSEIPDFESRRIDFMEELPAGGRLGDFSVELLQEYIFVSFEHLAIDQPGDLMSLEIYEMLDPQAAYGLFSIWNEGLRGDGRRVNLRVDNRLVKDALAFWRGHYFFVLTRREGVDVSEMERVAGEIVEAISETNLHPVSVVQLPAEDLAADSLRFYLGPKALATNPEFPSILVPHLGFEEDAEITFGKYEPSQASLFLLAYPTPALAAKYATRIQNNLQAYFATPGRGVFLKRSGLLLGMFIGSAEEAAMRLDKVQYSLSVRWIYDRDLTAEELAKNREEFVGFFGIITRSIMFTGVFIVTVLSVGLLAGIARYGFVNRRPLASDAVDIVMLDLSEARRRRSD